MEGIQPLALQLSSTALTLFVYVCVCVSSALNATNTRYLSVFACFSPVLLMHIHKATSSHCICVFVCVYHWMHIHKATTICCVCVCVWSVLWTHIHRATTTHCVLCVCWCLSSEHLWDYYSLCVCVQSTKCLFTGLLGLCWVCVCVCPML